MNRILKNKPTVALLLFVGLYLLASLAANEQDTSEQLSQWHPVFGYFVWMLVLGMMVAMGYSVWKVFQTPKNPMKHMNFSKLSEAAEAEASGQEDEGYHLLFDGGGVGENLDKAYQLVDHLEEHSQMFKEKNTKDDQLMRSSHSTEKPKVASMLLKARESSRSYSRKKAFQAATATLIPDGGHFERWMISLMMFQSIHHTIANFGFRPSGKKLIQIYVGSFIAAYTADSIDEIGTEVVAALASNSFKNIPFLEGVGIVGRVATQASFTYVAVLLNRQAQVTEESKIELRIHLKRNATKGKVNISIKSVF